MKKKLLFVIESLVCAGAEKSLVTLLNVLDYSKYEVDLQLFAYGGEFESLVPEQVNVLPPLPYFEATSKSLGKVIFTTPKYAIARLAYSFGLRMGTYSNPQKAVLFWRKAYMCFAASDREYDAAIAYAQGTPTFYVADCIKAKKKFAWVNAIYSPKGDYRDYIEGYYCKYDKINCVSESAQETFKRTFSKNAEKSVTIYDINDCKMIERLARIPSDAEKDMDCVETKILTVGRMANQKRYDIAVEACRILKERGVLFKWYALGRGPLEAEIRASIREKGIEEQFILLGTRANPYPYYARSDIYVQTSEFEGFGLAIAEARMLNVPVVATRFDAVYAQMLENENGLVVDLTPKAVADGIQRLIEDKELYEHIRQYQMSEKKGNTEEIEKFYQLIEG